MKLRETYYGAQVNVILFKDQERFGIRNSLDSGCGWFQGNPNFKLDALEYFHAWHVGALSYHINLLTLFKKNYKSMERGFSRDMDD